MDKSRNKNHVLLFAVTNQSIAQAIYYLKLDLDRLRFLTSVHFVNYEIIYTFNLRLPLKQNYK